VSEILFHASPLLTEIELHHRFEQRLIAFRQLNKELRQELQAALEEEQRLLSPTPQPKPSGT
jgi:hypothetical protein